MTTMLAKPWWQSRTVMAIGAGMLVRALALVGLEVDAEWTTDVLLLASGFIADFVALWGRARARGPLVWRKGR